MVVNELKFNYDSMQMMNRDKQTGSNPIFKCDAMYGNVPVTVTGKFHIDSIEMKRDIGTPNNCIDVDVHMQLHDFELRRA